MGLTSTLFRCLPVIYYLSIVLDRFHTVYIYEFRKNPYNVRIIAFLYNINASVFYNTSIIQHYLANTCVFRLIFCLYL